MIRFVVSRLPVLLKTRMFCTTPVAYQSRGLMRLKKLQADYQCEDGLPIWLKAGFRDRVLYTSTILLCYVGVFMCLAAIYEWAKPPAWRQNA